MLKYKIDVLKVLKEKGYPSTRLRKEKLLAQSTIQYIREGEVVGAKALDVICRLTGYQPGTIIEWIPDEE